MTQHISTLMDGELDTHASEQAIQECGSAEGRQAWATYHLIGESMRREGCRDFDISARVMSVVAGEPAIIARPKPKPMQSFGRIALAAAASVATIGVVGWIGMQGVPGSSSPAVAQSGVTMQINEPVAQARHQEPAKLQEAGKLQVEPAYAAIEVNDYLAAHRQQPTPDQYRSVAARTPAR
jgi:sigma-E factor negative regulatory protein RseA